MQFSKRLLCSTACILGALPMRAQIAPAVPAAPPSLIKLEPLRVTADLWETPLERMSAGVSVYDERNLRQAAVRHFGDLVDEIPNLTWTGGTSRPRYFQIRGIGENSQYEGETPDSTVRFLIDDLDFTGLGGVGSAFDVRQVEVLRGPQAGAFGANAAGGVVRLVTNAPTPFWTGSLEVTVGEDGLREGGFAIGGPLRARQPEQLMTRFTVHRHVSDGFRRNLTLNRDANARDETLARLRFVWNPAEQWRWEMGLLYAAADNGFDEFALDNNGTLTFSNRAGRDEQDSFGASIRGTHTGFSSARLTTVTSASWTDSRYSYDDDWTAASYDGFSDLTRDRRVFAQEVRLDSSATPRPGQLGRWTIGGYFSRTSEDSAYTNEDPDNIRGLRTGYASDQAALFGQVGHDLTSRTRLIVGLRGEYIDIAGDGTRTRFRKPRASFDAPASFAPAFDDTLVGGKITLEHELNSRQLVFASVTRGYKGGGVNVDARISPPDDPLVYDTEYLWNFEAGVRGRWWDQRLTGDITVFRLLRKDTQVRDSAGFGGSYRFFTANANDAEVYGLEATGSFQLVDAWTVHGSFARMESSLDRFVLANGSVGGGRALANTPRYGYTLGLRYHPEAGWFGRVETTGRARQFDSNNHDEARRAFGVVNASIGYSWRNWTVTAWSRNLFDEEYDKRVFFFGNEDPDYIPTRYTSRADPRQFGVTASYRF
jgi:iron complex outermembrane receptor protein